MHSKILLHFTLAVFIFTISTHTTFAQVNTIKITDFSVNAKDKKVMIDWKTDGKAATNYFAIQKSSDGINYRTIAMVLGPDPKQNNCDCYGCSDKYTTTSKQYYRLVHVAADGTEQVSAAKMLAML